MQKGLITAALVISSIANTNQTSTSQTVTANQTASVVQSVAVMNPSDMASIDNALDIASTSALIASYASTTASTTTLIAEAMPSQFKDNTGVLAYVKKEYANEPVLIGIARCESSDRQYDDKTGDVLHGNVDKEDIGVMQINEKYQLAKAASLGYNIDTVEGNVAYAQYLYDTQGAAPWSASQPCWGSALVAQATAKQAQVASQSLAVN